jgi:hypothetical protein
MRSRTVEATSPAISENWIEANNTVAYDDCPNEF